MIWSYLSQFWDQVSSVIVTSGEYTVAWFQSLGNAVAGAVGSVFDGVFHVLLDIMFSVSYVVDIFMKFFRALIKPIDYFVNYLWSGLSSLFAPLDYDPELTNLLPVEIADLFNNIPYWSFFTWTLGAVLLFFVGYKIYRLILKI